MIATRVSPILAKELLILPDLWLNIILHKAAPLGQSVGTFVLYMLPIGTFVPYMLPIGTFVPYKLTTIFTASFIL